eukprot:136152-Amphidinium_carterae.1
MSQDAAKNLLGLEPPPFLRRRLLRHHGLCFVDKTAQTSQTWGCSGREHGGPSSPRCKVGAFKAGKHEGMGHVACK